MSLKYMVILLYCSFFPEFKKNPTRDFIVIPHLSEEKYFSKNENIVFPSEPWEQVMEKILGSKFVISSSLHGIVVAEAYGIPARLLRLTDNEPMFKYYDYYLGTGRKEFRCARSISEALEMGGEVLPELDIKPIINAFPWELFENPKY